jgi:hypothetical protein
MGLPSDGDQPPLHRGCTRSPGSRARDGQLTKRIAAVDEEPGIRCSPSGDPPQHPVTGLGMTPIKRADADGEHDVVRLLVRMQDEVLGRDAAETQAAGPDLLC